MYSNRKDMQSTPYSNASIKKKDIKPRRTNMETKKISWLVVATRLQKKYSSNWIISLGGGENVETTT